MNDPTPAAPPCESDSDCLLLLLEPKLKLGFSATLPNRVTSPDGRAFERAEPFEGFFYDWLRTAAGQVIGVRYDTLRSYEENKRFGDLDPSRRQAQNRWMEIVDARDYVKVLEAGYIEIYFSHCREYEKDYSWDQWFLYSEVFLSLQGDLILAVETSHIEISHLLADTSEMIDFLVN